MMNFSIKELNAFAVIGQEVELTNYQKKNIQISTQFWRKFNSSLKKSYLSQSGNWVKYAFMERRNGKLYYFCSIPKRTILPDNFLYKEIPSYKYLVVEHIGAMGKIYETYRKIYQEIIPNTPYTPIKNIILHFEKYDYRFHWNRDNSVIEIWIPIQAQFHYQLNNNILTKESSSYNMDCFFVSKCIILVYNLCNICYYNCKKCYCNNKMR